jgi:hypothetical protein
MADSLKAAVEAALPDMNTRITALAIAIVVLGILAFILYAKKELADRDAGL